MALVTNSKDSLYGGVNQQAAEHRLPTQVKECINAHPTVNNGLLKRNPTNKMALSDNIDYSGDMFVYAYDRGLAGDKEEKYSIHITENGMYIVDTLNGEVFNETNGGLVFENVAAKDYLSPFSGSNGYAAVTIKDTTFLLNKQVQPSMLFQSFSGVNTSVDTKNVKTINLHKTVETLFGSDSYAPYKMREFKGTSERCRCSLRYDLNGIYLESANHYANAYRTTFTIYDIKGATVNINIDGYITSYVNSVDCSYDVVYGTDNCVLDSRESFSTWVTNLSLRIKEMLPNTLYSINVDSNDNINIIKFDGTAITATFDITVDPTPFRILPSKFIVDSMQDVIATEADFYSGLSNSTTDKNVVVANTTYAKEGFVWIKSSNPTTAYTYNVTVKDSNGNMATHSETASTTTEAAATAIATAINADANFSATAVGSIVKITATNFDMQSVETSDSYGNQASFGWAKTVSNYTELPKKLGFNDAIVNIDGDVASAYDGYWLNYIDGAWKECVAPNIDTIIDAETMPHILVREFGATGKVVFRLKQWDGWAKRRVGDNDGNPLPSFMLENNSIKDIFFFKNRLGFITQRNVILSEVGGYGNFFRTTQTSVLDSDRIDTTVDTTKAIELEYVTYLEDSLMLFSDNAQFKLEGGEILSPKSIQVSQTSAYEINKNVRPIFMNDKVFFCAKRGDYTAVMQYHVFGDGRISEAVDITSHVDKYIPIDVHTLSGSAINNMLFLTCKSTPSTVYVYKYLDSGDERVQSAWFKWEYNGELYSAFTLGKNLNVLINRYQDSAVTDWVLGDGIWTGANYWTADGIWYGSPAELTQTDNFEVQAIHPQSHTGYFVDASEFVEDTDVVENLTSTVTSSALEYVCYVQMLYEATIMLINENITTYTIRVDTEDGAIHTSTNEPLTVPRSVADFVTKVTITVNDAAPTIFTGVSYLYDSETYANELLPNGMFDYGIDGWTFTNWTVNYGQKDIGSFIPVYVDLDEWVFKAGDVAQTRGTLKMKTCQINSEDGSDFELEVRDVQRNSTRKVKSRYTVNRKPMVYGDSRYVRLAILNNTANGFRINSVSLEGNYNSRSRRL